MKITSDLFAAFLKCPTKCWLHSRGEIGAGNKYAEWVLTRTSPTATQTQHACWKAFPKTSVPRRPCGPSKHKRLLVVFDALLLPFTES